MTSFAVDRARGVVARLVDGRVVRCAGLDLGLERGDWERDLRPLLGAGRASRRGTLWQVLFDKRHTPGTNNPNPLVKWPAHVWNVTQVTLWSSKNPPPSLSTRVHSSLT